VARGSASSGLCFETVTPVDDLFAAVAQTPAVQSLRQRLEAGGVCRASGVHAAAQPFLSALLHRLQPERTLLIVTADPKTQERYHQDLLTWLDVGTGDASHGSLAADPTAGSEDGTRVLPRPRPLFYPAWEDLPQEDKLPHVDVIAERLETLVALDARVLQPQGAASGCTGGIWPTPPIVVASVEALLQRSFPRTELRARVRSMRKGDMLDPLDLIEWLEEQAYEPEAQVTSKGDLALRGGIVDVFPLTSPWPVRLEFVGNQLESLRHFDPHTQISREEISAITLPPAGELGLLKRALQTAPAASSRPRPTPATPGLGSGLPRRAAAQATAPPVVGVAPGNLPPLASLLEYLPPDTLIVLCEPDALAERARAYASRVRAGDPFLLPWEQFQTKATATGFTLLGLVESDRTPAAPALADFPATSQGNPAAREPDESPAAPRVSASAEDATAASPREGCELGLDSLEAFRPLGSHAPELPLAEAQRREFFAQLHRWLRQDYSVHVFCNNTGERERFDELWHEYGLAPAAPSPSPAGAATRTHTEPPAGEGTSSRARVRPQRPDPLSAIRDPQHLWWTHLGTLARGFLCAAARRVVVTDAEIFGRYRVQRPRRLKSPHAAAVRSAFDINFTELEEGDYVVHLQHGIGRYLGLQRLTPAPTRRGDPPIAAGQSVGEECLVIEYAPREDGQTPPKLYVPITEAHLVSKYVGAGKGRPPLHTLGGTRWLKAKAQAAQAVQDLAAELLGLQAARDSQPGFAYPADAPWQREFESAFVYEETPDQLQAIAATKRDLERARPMDRLICGDVGFGKTEVAIRAAFKAVLAGKQVAVLVPTTVLAQQHFNTFRERMADYPVRLELLSRFRTRAQQERVLRDLAAGAVDIVIGTHRLVQKDVAFKELGLAIIDEEQRFGVLHKEKLKQLRQLVDVLTLSATPIPRTLYLALTGARDLSTIETPPQDRLPIETVIAAYDERLIREAIQRELRRGGQVFYLHNRVLDIETVALRLKTLVPEARLEIGHGQMHSDDLEEVMTRFVNGETDVLLSTTIIESGIDIPNANTIIIDRADRFGLSDLYQLRGRVGRNKHQAYAYLLIPRHAGLLADARKRITAIKQFSTPGSGYKIAMRDLELRGAGNLLGPQQSGHITAIGFELYCQLLQQSIAALKGEPRPPRLEVAVRFDFLDLSPVGLSSAQRGLASACLPLQFIPEPQHRIEVYRRLAQATDDAALEALRRELRDRFGPLPKAVELLLQVAELKILAASQGLTTIETREDRLMVSRGGDWVQVGGRFPRLTKQEPRARLKEIRRLLVLLGRLPTRSAP